MIKSGKVFFALSMLACSMQMTGYTSPRLVGYYTNWAQYRAKPGAYTPENLKNKDPQTGKSIAATLTHINYAFFFLNYQSAVKPIGTTNDWKINFAEWNDNIALKAVVSAAAQNGSVVLASVGGWGFNDPASSVGSVTVNYFSEMVADSAKYTPFIQSCIALCQKYGLKGIDLDWEFPGMAGRGGTSSDYANFQNFAQIFGAQLHSAGLLLTAAIPPFAPSGFLSGTYSGGAVDASNPDSYIQWLSDILVSFDFYNVMTYDYNGAFPGTVVTGENAPLYPLPGQSGYTNIQASVEGLLATGSPPSKLVIGVGSYGRTFEGVSFPSTLLNGQPFGPGASYKKPGSPGSYTGSEGFLAYYEILGNLKSNFYERTQTNGVTQTAYAWGTLLKTWVSYDSPATAQIKGEYIISNGLGGGMIYTLDFDNFFDSKNPNAITHGLANGLGIVPR